MLLKLNEMDICPSIANNNYGDEDKYNLKLELIHEDKGEDD